MSVFVLFFYAMFFQRSQTKCRNAFHHRDEVYQSQFDSISDQYLQRLNGKYNGPCLEVSPETFSSLEDTFSWEKEKKKGTNMENEVDSDFGEQRRVDSEGHSRASKKAVYHFNLKSVVRRAGAGRGPTAPTAHTFNPPSKATSNEAASSSSSSAASSSSSSSATSHNLPSPSKRATGKGRRVINTGPKHRFILFRHSNPMLQREAGFPVLLGEVIGINEDPENESGWKGRPDGSIDPVTGLHLKERWKWAVKRWALKMTVNENLSKIPDIRKAAWWSPNYIVDYERTTNHNHLFIDKKTCERIHQKYTKKSTKGASQHAHSILYVDFDNPNHGLILLDDNAEFTKSQSLLSKHCVKCLVRKDKTVQREMDKYAQDKLHELEIKKGHKSGKKASAASGSSSSEAHVDVASESYSPFLALVDRKEATDSEESEVGGIFENESEDEDGKEKSRVGPGSEMVAAFIDKVNASKDDEDLAEGLDEDSDESDEPDDVVFVGGRPTTNIHTSSSSSSSFLALRDTEEVVEQKKRKGRPAGSKNIPKKK